MGIPALLEALIVLLFSRKKASELRRCSASSPFPILSSVSSVALLPNIIIDSFESLFKDNCRINLEL